jgi:hypothetical protein
MQPRICVVTAGHLSTCPRMVKAADALHADGCHVRVVSARFVPWANATDTDLRKQHPGWEWEAVDWSSSQPQYIWTGVRQRLSRAAASVAGAGAPLSLLSRARERAFTELTARAAARSVDLVYGGGGALEVTAAASDRLRVPFAFDLEDFHTAQEEDGPRARRSARITASVERLLLPRAALLTTSSRPIAEAYERAYGVRPVVIHNTFPLPARAPALHPNRGALRLYWFSQTIGPGRGLEDVVTAAGLAGSVMELHLRGNAYPDYIAGLLALAQRVAPRLSIHVHAPSAPDRMVELCQRYDVGLSVEDPVVPNHDLCLSNKTLTYMLAGLALVLTDTAGQREVLPSLDGGALVYRTGDTAALAEGLRRWDQDRSLLLQARERSWAAALNRWHWEHDQERGALLDAVGSVVR